MKQNVITRCYGFTLLELMAAIFILAIVLSIGIPSFQTLINNNRVATQVNTFVTSLNLARSEAIKRGSNVVVAAAGAGWADGWTVATADGTVLRRQDALKNDSTLAALDGTTTLTFDSNGFLNNGNTVTLNLCNTESTTDKQVIIMPGGKVSLDSNFDCGG